MLHVQTRVMEVNLWNRASCTANSVKHSGQHCGTAHRAADCDASSPHGCPFMPQLFCFWFSSCYWLRKSSKWRSVCLQYCSPHGKTWMKFLASGFSLAQPWAWQPFGKWGSKWKVSLLSLCNSEVQIHT